MPGSNEYDSPIWDKQPWMCRSVDPGLSNALKNNDYDSFIKTFEALIKSRYGVADIENINIICEGQCPKGCGKKFNLKLNKSLTKKSFEKIYKHGIKYPQHCLEVKYIGVIKNNAQ